VTTNPVQATGDATAMGLRQGVAVADVEFMQFHPTALHHPSMPRPLLSEALRGHGALLRDTHGERFVDELLPRDQVSRAMTARMIEQGVDHLWLDATTLERFDVRFPTIARTLREVGLDPAMDWLPIAPAAHYLSGGLLTDLDGATSLPGLWAAGEAACTGVHGANRLASNSLLEGMVFAPRVIEAIDAGKVGPAATGAMCAALEGDDVDIPGRPLARRLPRPTADGVPDSPEKLRDRLQRAMTAGAGVLRSEESLAGTLATIDDIAAAVIASGETSPAMAEIRNLLDVGAALVHAARARTESRGNHWRSDHLETDPEFRVRLVQS
jgi:L-aspartate oxidase